MNVSFCCERKVTVRHTRFEFDVPVPALASANCSNPTELIEGLENGAFTASAYHGSHPPWNSKLLSNNGWYSGSFSTLHWIMVS